MTGPVFIDSNIWLYAFLKQDEVKRKIAKDLIKSWRSDQVFVSSQIINEVTFNLKKNNFQESVIKKIISAFYNDYLVIELNEKIVLKASGLREKYSISFWDSLVIAAALSEGSTTLYTEDLQQNQVIERKLKIINPFTTT